MGSQVEMEQAVLRLDAWFDTMRCTDGYGGPVAHWWQDCLLYTGAGLDWRYEGIIIGYLNLYERTGNGRWLAKARRAGDDLVQGQLPSGNYRDSSFELNPCSGGTPHEAACDLALLQLAQVLKKAKDPAWQGYAAAAEKNLRAFVLGVLWDQERRVFGNTTGNLALVPNKAATIVEALLAWAALSGDEEPLAQYARPALEAILECQVRASGIPLDGAIYQGVQAGQKNERFFPFYIARCIPALVAGYGHFAEERYLDAAQRAAAFIGRQQYPDGSYPQVVYPRQLNRYPQWVAGTGDILRALDLVDANGGDGSREATLDWLLAGLKGPSPRTAHGFAAQVSQASPPSLPDFRDLLGVAGWADKAFRYLAGTCALTEGEALSGLASPGDLPPTPEYGQGKVPCLFQGSEAVYYEDEGGLQVQSGGKLLYRWRKGVTWAELGPA